MVAALETLGLTLEGEEAMPFDFFFPLKSLPRFNSFRLSVFPCLLSGRGLSLFAVNLIASDCPGPL